MQLGTTDVNLPAEAALGDAQATLSVVIDDFNGDFIDDVALTTGATPERPGGTLLLFSDGVGGLLSEVVHTDQAPTRRGVTAKTDELCVGFYNDKTKGWECEDECLEERGGDLLCGETDHF